MRLEQAAAVSVTLTWRPELAVAAAEASMTVTWRPGLAVAAAEASMTLLWPEAGGAFTILVAAVISIGNSLAGMRGARGVVEMP